MRFVVNRGTESERAALSASLARVDADAILAGHRRRALAVVGAANIDWLSYKSHANSSIGELIR